MKTVFLIVIFLGACVLSTAYAGDSITIAVSCRIPAIPGVNVPLQGQAQQVQPNAQTTQPQQMVETKSVVQNDGSVKTVEIVYSK